MLGEFRDFIAKGNVIDLAVAVIIGGAFALITASLTDDIIMPIVGYIFGGADFANNFVVLGEIPADFAGNPAIYADLKEAGVPVIGWGQFLTVIINFVILAFVIFLMVKQANKWIEAAQKKKEEEAEESGPSDNDLLAEIRDLLKKD